MRERENLTVPFYSNNQISTMSFPQSCLSDTLSLIQLHCVDLHIIRFKKRTEGFKEVITEMCHHINYCYMRFSFATKIFLNRKIPIPLRFFNAYSFISKLLTTATKMGH